MTNPARALTILTAFALSACGDAEPQADSAAPSMDSQSTPAAAEVTLNVESSAREDGNFDLTAYLTATGVEIVPAGDTTSGTGHHHLYLNAELAPAGQPVPSRPGSVIHMGDGSSTYTFEGVPAGEHRMIAVVADGVHVPLQPWVVDTVTVTVGDEGTDD